MCVSLRDEAAAIIEKLGVLVELIEQPEHQIGDIHLVVQSRSCDSLEDLMHLRQVHGALWKVYLHRVEEIITVDFGGGSVDLREPDADMMETLAGLEVFHRFLVSYAVL